MLKPLNALYLVEALHHVKALLLVDALHLVEALHLAEALLLVDLVDTLSKHFKVTRDHWMFQCFRIFVLIRPRSSRGGHSTPPNHLWFKAIQGYKLYKAIQGPARPQMAIKFHNVPQKYISSWPKKTTNFYLKCVKRSVISLLNAQCRITGGFARVHVILFSPERLQQYRDR